MKCDGRHCRLLSRGAPLREPSPVILEDRRRSPGRCCWSPKNDGRYSMGVAALSTWLEINPSPTTPMLDRHGPDWELTRLGGSEPRRRKRKAPLKRIAQRRQEERAGPKRGVDGER